MVVINSVTRAAVLLAATAAQVSALGSAIVHNQCDFDVYLWAVGDLSGSMETIAANGGAWSQQYQNNPDGGGMSIKLGSDPKCDNITQFEYTLDGASLWYDLSNINGYPFASRGVTVVPTDSTCRGVACPAGQTLCAQAYNVPTDNFATAECGSDADSVVVLCSDATDTDGSSSISSVASVVASTVSAAPTTSSTVEAQTTTTEAAPTTTSTTHVVVKSSTESVQKTTSTHHWTHESWGHTYTPVHHTQAAAAETTAPATTEAPTQAPANNNPYVVVETTFVTHVVTVEARSPQPTAAAEEKRELHHHDHAAVHKDHLAPRHHQHPRNFAKR